MIGSMSLVIATGSNLGDKLANLKLAKDHLSARYRMRAQSRVYSSPPAGLKDQPGFYNQVLEFELPDSSPQSVMEELLSIEEMMGRKRIKKWGPRLIDLDILFWGTQSARSANLEIPHPRWSERAFVVLPLREVPFFQVLRKSYKIPEHLEEQEQTKPLADKL